MLAIVMLIKVTLVTENNNKYYRHATCAARKLGDRAAIHVVFNLDRDTLIMNERQVQELFKTAIKKNSNTC